MEFVTKVFLKLDLFSKDIQLTINRKTSYKTVLGGVVSLAVLASVICITGFYLSDVINHREPTFFFENSEYDEFPIQTLNKTNFIMGLRIEDDSNNVLDSSYFDIVTSYDEFVYPYANRTDVYKQYTQIDPTEKCTTQDFYAESTHIDGEEPVLSEMTDKMFYDESIGTFMCGKFNNRLVGGDWTSSTLRYFTFFVKKCDKSTEKLRGVNCQNETAYKNKKFYVGFKILNYQVRPTNFLNPVTPTFTYSYVTIADSYTKYITVNLSKSSFNADNNLILGNKYVKEVITLDKYLIDVRNMEGRSEISDKVYMEMPVYLRRNYNKYIRSYMKLQDVLGIVGGFLSMFVYFISLFYNFYLSITYKYFLYESILDFRVNEGKGDETISMNTLMAEDFDAFSKSPNVKPSMRDIQSSGKDQSNEDLEAISLYHTNKKENEKEEAHCLGEDQERERIENGLNVEPLSEDKINSHDNKELIELKVLTKRNIVLHIEDANSFNSNMNSKDNSLYEQEVSPQNFPNNLNYETNLVKRQTRLLQIVDKFQKKREKLAPLELNRSDYFCFKYMYFIKKKTDKLHAEKKQIIKLSENEMYRRMDLINLMKHLDQISLLENSLLNKHQKFMLENKSKQIVYNKYSDEVEQGKKIEEEAKVMALADYLKRKKEAKTLSKVDYCLLENMDGDKKNRILTMIGLASKSA